MTRRVETVADGDDPSSAVAPRRALGQIERQRSADVHARRARC